MANSLILVTGVSGYVGGRLVHALGDRAIRCMARTPDAVRGNLPAHAELVQGDVLDPASLDRALAGVDVAYYLIHSLTAGAAFEEQDRIGASNFAAAAKRAGVRRIIYLGGLGEPATGLSSHLRSRQDTGAALRAGGVPVIEFRAAAVIGSGSLSFELVRALVERLPVMICPRWVSTLTQPIGIDSVLAYLVAGAYIDSAGAIFEIGGRDVCSYGDIMREYAKQRGLERHLISVPFLTPRLSSLWLALVTPVYARVGRPLIEGMRNPTIVRDKSALERFDVRPMTLQEMVARALEREDEETAAPAWMDAVSSSAHDGWGGARFGSRLVETHVAHTSADPVAAFAPIARIGGRTGWYYANALWKVRGIVDQIVGGPGLRRGRGNAGTIRVGDYLDWWRVEAYEPGHSLRLRAEMRLPGRAWLQFDVTPEGDGSRIQQTAIFDPVGIAGLLYWYTLYPVHRLIFAGMLREVVRNGESVLG